MSGAQIGHMRKLSAVIKLNIMSLQVARNHPNLIFG